MKFYTFRHNQLEKIGVQTKDGKKMISLKETKLSKEFTDMNDFIKNNKKSDMEILEKLWKQETKANKYYSFDEIEILAPIPKPLHDVISIGLNYKEHLLEVAKELNMEPDIPTSPVIFTKRARYATGTNGTIPLHENITNALDYEAELGVIIGKEVSDIEKNEVEDNIFGFTVMNDMSARDLMVEHKQWTIGKGLDGCVVMGPCIVHKDYVDFPVELNISSKVNNELRQNSNTKNFIFTLDDLVSRLSKGITLEAGDIISTGTPAGVGMSMKPPVFLKDGDVIECEIQGIGVLTNTIKK